MNPDTPSPTLSSDMLQTAPLHDDERWKQQIKNKVMFEDLLPEEKRVCVSRQFLAQCSSDSQTSSSKALCWFTFPQSHRSHSCLFVCVFGCVCVFGYVCVCSSDLEQRQSGKRPCWITLFRISFASSAQSVPCWLIAFSLVSEQPQSIHVLSVPDTAWLIIALVLAHHVCSVQGRHK